MPAALPKPLRTDALVASNACEGGANHRLGLRVPDWPGFEPGQFVMLSPGAIGAAPRTDPLLPRPMAVYRATGDGIEILYKRSGRGTSLLSEARPGERVRVVGPLGQPFRPPLPGERALLVGGGTGVAHELERLASLDDVRKVSRRDLPIVIAQQGNGATTVAATMWIAAQAGIQVFATGGIGGVHRGQPFDVSADLPELAQTPVVVICAGAKAILDLPLTLEWLETHGVPVLGFGTDTFPAFYSRSSGLPVDARCDTADDAAHIIRAKFDLGLPGGVLIGVPVPEEYAVAPEDIEPAIQQALKMAGKQRTFAAKPFPRFCWHVSELTGGESLKANIALLENNARVAAQIARAL